MKYRIKKVSTNDSSLYFPQYCNLFFWNTFKHHVFTSFTEAENFINEYKRSQLKNKTITSHFYID